MVVGPIKIGAGCPIVTLCEPVMQPAASVTTILYVPTTRLLKTFDGWKFTPLSREYESAPVPPEAVTVIEPSLPPLQLTSVAEVLNVIAVDREIVTVSRDDVQVPLLMVQTNELGPRERPVTPEEGLVGVVTAPVPAMTVQIPEPIVGVFPASVAVDEHAVWSNPAFAVVGG